MDLVAVGIAAFLVGGLVAGAFGWLLATARARAAMEAPLREAESRRAAETARADGAGPAAPGGARADGRRRSRSSADTFAALAHETLRASQEDFLTLANERLGAVREQTTIEVEARQAAQQQAIEGMVAPVRASLEKFDEQIRAMELARGTAYGELRQQLKTVTETQVKLHDATGSLVSALKAPAVRGRWGEMQLRRVVELAGMLEHCDFDRADDDRGRRRPLAAGHDHQPARRPAHRRRREGAAGRVPRGARSGRRRDARGEVPPARGAGARARHEAGREELLGRARRRARHGRDVSARRAALQRGAGADAGADRRGRGAEGADRDADDAARAAAHGQLRLARGAARGERGADRRRGTEAARTHRHRARAFFAARARAGPVGQALQRRDGLVRPQPGQLRAAARRAGRQGEEGAPRSGPDRCAAVHGDGR